MAGILNAELAFPQFPALDQFGPNTTLLLHGDGTNGAQNNTFLDSSTNNFTITRNGNTTQGTFSPFSQPNGWWSNYFNQSGFLYNLSTSVGSFGTNNFTVEFWLYTSSAGNGSQRFIYDTRQPGIDTGTYVIYDSSNNLLFALSGTTIVSASASICPVNQWFHVAICRTGTGSNQVTMYINGNSVSTGTIGTSISSNQLGVGAGTDAPLGVVPFLGYISNLRIVNGTAVYTSNFAPPTAPLTAITNTVVLTCQSNRFIDNSASPVTFTVSGAPSVQAFKPFSSPTSYFPAVNSGGGYFDGSGDYLQTPSSSSVSAWSTDFTIECWVYPISISSGPGIWTNSTSNSDGFTFGYVYSNGSIGLGRVGVNEIASAAGVISINRWYHVAFVRNGSATNIYVNGVSVASGGTSVLETTTTKPLTIAGNFQSGGAQWNGYISDFRVVKGTAVYTSNFTPPTTPLTAITNTQLLASMTNAGIIDSVSQNALETVGNAQVSTTQSKFGGASMSFDGSSYASLLNNPVGTLGDFTIEGWFYSATATTAFQVLFEFGGNSNQNSLGTIALALGGPNGGDAGSTVTMFAATSGTSGWAIQVLSASGVTSNNTWHHFAVVRSGGTFTTYINGNAVCTSTAVSATTALYSGTLNWVGSLTYPGYRFSGYLDDFRVTRGIARYTQNFTPPQNALPDYGPLTNIPTVDPNFRNTTLLLHGNGTNGAQNNTFLDSSTNNFTITRNGNTTQGTFTPFSQPNGWWSNFFGGSSYISVANNTNLDITGTYTIEFWYYQTSGAGTQYWFNRGGGGASWSTSNGVQYMVLSDATNLYWQFNTSGGTSSIQTALPSANQWHHIAIGYNGTTTRMWVDGLSVGTSSGSYTVPTTTNLTYIANAVYTNGYFLGYISNFRFVKGTDIYGVGNTTITVPILPVTAITNTQLLTCQSNRFIDNSTNALAITPSGTPSTQNFYPFFPPLDYTTAAIGGSGYYDGSGDFLNTPTSGQFTAAGDFTVSCWFYLQSFAASYYAVGGNWSAGTSDEWLIQIQNDGSIRFLTSADGTFSSAGVVKLNQWTYFTATRSGTTVTVQVNGTTVRTYTKSDTLGSATKSINIGQQPGNNWPWNGYIADFRLVSGSAVTTIPTTPATAISGTGLLLSCTNGAIFDNASKNNLETVGNAQISTTQSKFGGSSMYFDGSNPDCLSIPVNPNTSLTGDFTIEAWIYMTANAPIYDGGIFSRGPNGTLAGYVFGIRTGNYLTFYMNYAGYDVTSSGTIPLNTWTYIAVSRQGTSLRLFINGTIDGSATTSTVPTMSLSDVTRVGCTSYGLVSQRAYTGYIDDLRVTTGIARYRYNFTPPAAPFPNK